MKKIIVDDETFGKMLSHILDLDFRREISVNSQVLYQHDLDCIIEALEDRDSDKEYNNVLSYCFK